MKTQLHLLISLSFVFLFFSCDREKGDSVEVNVNMNQTHQTIEGFGTCLVTYKDYPSEYSNPDFFDRVVNDLGVSLMRIPVMEHTEYKNDNDNPDHFNWDGFYMKNNHRRKGMEEEMKLYQKFKKRGVNRFMATPWSPPQFLKTNRAPIKGGFLRADMTKEFAEFLAAYIILAKKNWGIDINWISIQNELLFSQFFRSCVYHPYILREAVRAVDRKFKEEGINTRILIPEDMMFPDRMLNYIRPTMNDPETKDFNGHFSTHRKAEKKGLQQWVSQTKQYNRQNWMTETSGHSSNWEGAFEMASDIHTYLAEGNFSAWVYWQLSGGGSGKYSILVNGEPTPKYYAAKHFYKFVRPGAKRVEVNASDDSILVSGYRHNEKSTLTAVLLNPRNEDVHVSLNGKDKNMPEEYKVYRSQKNENCEKIKTIKKGEKFLLPGKGIVTLVGENENLEKKGQSKMTEAWEVSKSVGDDKWGNFEPLNIEKEWQRLPDGNASYLEAAKKAVRNGNLDQTRFNGWTLLHDAILQGDGDAVKYLINNGADVNARANDGWTPLHAAAATFVGNRRLNTKKEDYNKYEVFKLVLHANPDINAKTEDGWTPLHAATANANTAWRQKESSVTGKVRDLIEEGANIDAQDINGRTPLHWACWQGYAHYSGGGHTMESDVVNVLINKGADLNTKDKIGRTPLHYAAKMGYTRIVYQLIQAGADHSVEDSEGNTALELAEKRELEEVVYTLKNKELPEGISVQADNIQRDTGKLGEELVQAAWNGNKQKVKELLEQGADVDYMDRDGFTAIERARDNGHEDIVELLKKSKK
jgi:ankyrin repeat protein/O-glycosyl hydrolase